MRYAVAASVLLVFFATGCNESKRTELVSPHEVMATLREAHVNPQRATYTLELGGSNDPATPFTEVIQQSNPNTLVPLATYDVEGGRALIAVFPSSAAATAYASLYSTKLRARNVVAVPAGTQPFSRGLRKAFLQLR